MCLFSLVLGAAASAVLAPQVDFGALPAPGTTPGYGFTLILEVAGGPAVRLPIEAGPRTTPATVAKLLDGALRQTPHDIVRGELRYTLRSVAGRTVTRVTVAAVPDGPRPLVTYVQRQTPKPKDK